MAIRRGRAWGNALGGYKRQRRDAKGRFSTGRTGGTSKKSTAKKKSTTKKKTSAKKKPVKQRKGGTATSRRHLSKASLRMNREVRGAAVGSLVGNKVGTAAGLALMGTPGGVIGATVGAYAGGRAGVLAAAATNNRAYKSHLKSARKGGVTKKGVAVAVHRQHVATATVTGAVAASALVSFGVGQYRNLNSHKVDQWSDVRNYERRMYARSNGLPGMMRAKARRTAGGKVYNVTTMGQRRPRNYKGAAMNAAMMFI